MKIVKKLSSGLFMMLTVLSLAAATPVALAATNTDSTSVVNSGDNATVNSSSNQTSTVNVSNSNTALVSQTANGSANTGGNTADRNISTSGAGTSVTTGPATVNVTMGVTANRNLTAVGGSTTPSTTNATDVVNTGNDSTVNTSTNTNTTTNVANTNTAEVSQSCGGLSLLPTDSLSLMGGGYGGGCSANTGYNKANRNIGGATVNTGAASVTTNMGADLNVNATVVGGGSTNGTLGNGTTVTNTGDDAYVNTSANSNNTVDVANSNEALVYQSVFGKANTGKNKANRNIGDTSVTTGPAAFNSMMAVDANRNYTALGGGLSSQLNLGDIVNTGNNLDSNTNVNSNLTTDVANSNLLDGYQYSHQYSNSGYSKSSKNVGTTTVHTGLAGSGMNFSLMGNTNATGVGGLMDMMMLDLMSLL